MTQFKRQRTINTRFATTEHPEHLRRPGAKRQLLAGIASASLALCAFACGNVSEEKSDANTPIDGPSDAAIDGALACPVGAIAVCSGASLVTCDGQGHATNTEACALGCNDTAKRCNKLDPSNGLASSLDDAATANDLVLSGAATIDTDAGTVTDTSGSRVIQSSGITAGLPVGLFVIKVKSFATGGDVTVVGTRALVIVSAGTVKITHTLSVSARARLNGPGSLLSDTACRGGSTSGNANGWPGAGGGGFGSAGGRGGTGGSPLVQGGLPGGVSGTTELVPLRGGCPGGRDTTDNPSDYAVGAAGGAIQIVSNVKIELADGGFVAANGSGGGKFQGLPTVCPTGGPCDHGEGGGSGGAILLEAPVVTVNQLAGVVSNGGGGGCNVDGTGAAGSLSAVPALGSTCQQDPSKGGDGAAGLIAAQNGGNGASGKPVGGGGGGGAGRIRVNVAPGTQFSPLGAVSGARSTGFVGLR